MATVTSDVVGRLSSIYDDLEANVAKVSNRRDLILATDLVYHSPRSFFFQGKKVTKGALELLVLGDTRTGKTSTISSLMQHYRAGDMINSEAVSLAGLLAGVDEGGSTRRRFIRAGRLPLAHRKLVVFDESNELPDEIVGKLSGVRSSGVLDIVKINTARMACLVRQIWIANTKGEKTLEEYAYGIEAVQDFMRKPEDLARFDLVVGYSKRDVDYDHINTASRFWKSVAPIWTSEICAASVRFAWSREANQVLISDETEDAILEQTRGLVAEFDGAVPILLAAEARIKVAKVAAAIATRLLSVASDNPSIVVVRPEHAEAAAWAYREMLNADSLRFGVWSKSRKGVEDLGIGAENVFRAIGRRGVVWLLRQRTISMGNLAQLFGDREMGTKAVRAMIFENVVTQAGRSLRLTEKALGRMRQIEETTRMNGSASGDDLWSDHPNPTLLRAYQPSAGEVEDGESLDNPDDENGWDFP